MRNYIKGRIWCMTFHAPVLRCLGGYGGVDYLHRQRKAYHNMWCVKCDNRWQQKDRGEKCIGSHIWHFRKSERIAKKALEE